MSTQTDFISKVVSGAQAGQQKYGVLASMTIAQAILESGWGQHTIANNLFGIKVNGTIGKTVTVSTKEFVNGDYVNTVAAFRTYDSTADSVTDHSMFLAQNPRYKNLLGCKDYTKSCELLQQDGYATEPDYAVQLIGLIKEYKLDQYDTLPVKPAQHIEIIKNGTFYVHSKANTLSGIAGTVKGGQAYITAVLPSGWRQITFNGRTAYIGAAAFK